MEVEPYESKPFYTFWLSDRFCHHHGITAPACALLTTRNNDVFDASDSESEYLQGVADD
jgi:hypothetical protein